MNAKQGARRTVLVNNNLFVMAGVRKIGFNVVVGHPSLLITSHSCLYTLVNPCSVQERQDRVREEGDERELLE